MGDKKQSTDSSVLLHGKLDVEFHFAQGLLNKDNIGTCLPAFAIGFLGKSDPYCEVIINKVSLIRTSTKNNTINPEWNEVHTANVCNKTDKVTVRVVDKDLIGGQFLGEVSFTTDDLLKHATGVSGLDGCFPLGNMNADPIDVDKWANGWTGEGYSGSLGYGVLGIRIRFSPSTSLGYSSTKTELQKISETDDIDNLEVPHTYFPTRYGNRWKLYAGANQPGRQGVIDPVTLEHGKPYEVGTLWSDVAHSIEKAKEFVCIAGWSVNPDIRLVRHGAKANEQPTLGQILIKKAEEGVLVMIMVWDDMSSTKFSQTGMMSTFDEKCKAYFKGSKVCVAKVSRNSDEIIDSLTCRGMFTHHQKSIIVDSPKQLSGIVMNIGSQMGKPSKIDDVIAYMGGVDLTSGRYDNSDKSLFATLGTLHDRDFYNRCADVNRNLGPRQPWQDVHARFHGEAAVDILKNFVERWTKQAGKVNPGTFLGNRASFKRGRYVRRLIHLLKGTVANGAAPRQRLHDRLDRWSEAAEEVIHPGSTGLKKPEEEKREIMNDPASNEQYFGVQVIRSIDSKSANLEKDVRHPRLRQYDKNILDNSIQRAYIHHIRRAKHFIYIENQYFIGSSQQWLECQDSGATNLIPAELTAKICQKIRNKEPFHAYIVLPMFPEGDPAGTATQQILRWQKLTIESMYALIAAEIQKQREIPSTEEVVGEDDGASADKSPQDYLTIYCLGNREPKPSDQSRHRTEEEKQEPIPENEHIQETLLRTRRFQIYVHSKLMIVDDEVAIVGSANINERSLAGTRDSELAACVFESDKRATLTNMPTGEIHGFRMSLWSEHLGGATRAKGDYDPELLTNPSSEDCYQHVWKAACKNWDQFAGEPVIQMDGHLMRYPIIVDKKSGEIKALQEHFPDFPEAKIFGTPSSMLPSLLTT